LDIFYLQDIRGTVRSVKGCSHKSHHSKVVLQSSCVKTDKGFSPVANACNQASEHFRLSGYPVESKIEQWMYFGDFSLQLWIEMANSTLE
jgi:hypothetical protein